MGRQQELQVNTTKFAKILAIKKTAEKRDMAHVTCRHEKKKQIQRGDVIAKYKNNLVGVKEKLN
jgi:hypothetical protein